jgi:large subunit ribosomal protein L9
MKVLLVKNVENLGSAGDALNVADGYARNYLLPRKLAVRHSQGATKMAGQFRKNAQEKEAREVEEARALAEKMAEHVFVLRASADENGHLYGGISEREIADELSRAGFDIDRRQVELDEHLKNVGEYRVSLKVLGTFHGEITVRVEAEE